MKTREELEHEGWERRSCEKEPRLSELVALYEELGFEVILLPATPQDLNALSCPAPCHEVELEKYRTIYTKRRA